MDDVKRPIIKKIPDPSPIFDFGKLVDISVFMIVKMKPNPLPTSIVVIIIEKREDSCVKFIISRNPMIISSSPRSKR